MYLEGEVPYVGNSNCNGSSWNNDWSWIIGLAVVGGIFGNGGFGFGGNNNRNCATQADLSAGFNNSAVLSNLNDIILGQATMQNFINQGFAGLNNTITQGFSGVDNAVCTLGYNMQAGFNTLGNQIATCCCETQRAIDSVKYENATNTCAIQNTIQNTTRDILENANTNSRAILDALNANYIRTLESENNSLKLSASQANQNAVLMAAMDANKTEILRRTGAECPTAAYIVQPPQPVTFPTNCCGQAQFGGCNSGF